MITTRPFWWSAAVFLTVAACTSPSPDASSLSAEDVGAIRESQQFFVDAELARNWAEAAGVFADDGIRLIPNMPAVEGRTAIQAQLESADTEIRAFTLTSSQIIGQANLAIDRGEYLFSFVEPDSGNVITDEGKYVQVWQQQEGGAWHVLIDTYNSSLSVEWHE